MQRSHTVQPSELMSETWRLEHPTVGKTINYSSRLEGFATQHWSQSRHKAVREEDVEAAGEEPLLGRNGPEHPKSILGLPMLEPSSWLAELVTMLTLLTDCTYTVFWVPCSVAFGTNPAKWSITSALDLLAGAIFTVNILQTLQTGIIVRYNLQRKIVMDGWIVASYYLKEGSMVADVLSTLPSIVQALSLIGLFGYPDAAVLRTLIVLRWLRVARLLLFLRGHLTTGLLGRLGRRLTAWRLPLTTYLLADILYCGCALTNFLGMLWLFCAQCEGLDNSWLADVGGEDLTSSSMLDIYVASVLFATSTMSTVGYGDIRARTTPERAVSMFIMLIGVLFFGFVISALGRLLEVSSPEARRAVLFRDKINKVDAWMSYRQLPGKLRTDIIGFYANSWAPQSEIHETKLYEELPAVLRGQVATHLLHDILESTGWWEALPESERWRLAAIMHPQQLLPGHDLTQEGEPAACLWLLQEGELLAIKHAVQWERLQAPALVGEEALLQGEGKEAPVRPCAYRAVGGCTLWALVVSELQPLLRTFPALRDRLTSVINTQHSPRVRHSLDLAAFDRSRLPAQSSPGAAAHPGRGQPGDTTRAGQPEEIASDGHAQGRSKPPCSGQLNHGTSSDTVAMLQADSRAALPDALQALQLQAATMAEPTASVQRKAKRLNTLKEEIEALAEQIKGLAEDLAQERAGIESSAQSIQQMSSVVVRLAARTQDHAQANGHN